MRRFFNTTGLCDPEDHYMVDPLRNHFEEFLSLMGQRQYFTLFAPSQTGKTTLLSALVKHLNHDGQYVSVLCSMKSAGYPCVSVEDGNSLFIKGLYRSCNTFLPEALLPPKPDQYAPGPYLIRQYLGDWCQMLKKPLVILLDEMEVLSDDDFLNTLLRQLRDGFQTRPHHFPQSIILVGLHDIRASSDNPSVGRGSHFNIKAKSFFLPVFSREEVRGLLDQHTHDTGQIFSAEVFEKLYACSGGQPWLTNALAREIVAKMLQNDYAREITPDMVETAKERLIEQRQTHLDSLADKMDEPRVRPIVLSIINGEAPAFDGFDDALRYCRDLGIITSGDPVRFANPIYREIITRILNSSMQRGIDQDIAQTSWYLRSDGTLDMDKLLTAFTDFYRRHSESWLERFQYKEAGHQLLLMAFLQRIVNGGGRIEREMALGNGRTDLAVFWKNQVFPIEIKMHHDKWSQPEGLQQLARYMDKLGQKHGYLVIFEKKNSEVLPWEQRIRREVHAVDDKEIVLHGM